MGYNARLTAPNANDNNWRHVSVGGKNSCIHIANGSVLANCVGYAWGRFMEILSSTPKLSRANAENWYGTNDGYERGQEPRLGAVVCWAKGVVGNGADGAGHVAVVEKVNADGSIVTSNSAYKGTRFYTATIKKPYNVKGYTFQGFIYNPAVAEENNTNVNVAVTNTKYKVGDTVSINGVYKSSNDTNRLNPAKRSGKITKIIQGARNPYLLDEGNLGWVNDSCVVDNVSTVQNNANIKTIANCKMLNLRISASYGNKTKNDNIYKAVESGTKVELIGEEKRMG